MTGSPERPAQRRLDTRTVYRNRWMAVREDQIVQPDGSAGVYSFVEKPDFAVVIPFDGDGFHLIEQYRYPLQRWSWEFPQGTVEDERDPTILARVELAEETGFRAGSLTLLGRLDPAPGMSTQGCWVVVATDLTPGQPAREPAEQGLGQRWYSRAEVARMIGDGEITDAATIAAYALFLLRFGRPDRES